MMLLLNKFKEVAISVLPIIGVVLILHFSGIASLPEGILIQFVFSSIVVIIGLALFMLGADLGILPMGEMVGSALSKKGKMSLMLIVGFLLGMMITLAEPDVQVLANQVATVGPDISQGLIVIVVAIGVGAFIAIGLFRIAMQFPLRNILIISYGIVFILAAFTPQNFLAVAFDAGGVTTGPMTVPFILALGVGIAATRSGKSSQEDSFGLVALGSIGPIMAVMILGVAFRNSPISGSLTPSEVVEISSLGESLRAFMEAAPGQFLHVGISLLPMVVMFIIFQVTMLKLSKKQLLKIAIGVLYTFIGLALFLNAVNVGFLPAGTYFGKVLAETGNSSIMIAVGVVLGLCVVFAEPAVHVLNREVADVSGGHISTKMMMGTLAIGVAIAVGISLFRLSAGISIWYFIAPGYLIAIILTFFTPKMFTAIAFDSGGVVSGPMTATFLLPLAIGACEALGGNVLTDAFGLVAMVAMIPLIVIQILGLVYELKSKIAARRLEKDVEDFFEEGLGDDEDIAEMAGMLTPEEKAEMEELAEKIEMSINSEKRREVAFVVAEDKKKVDVENVDSEGAKAETVDAKNADAEGTDVENVDAENVEVENVDAEGTDAENADVEELKSADLEEDDQAEEKEVKDHE